MSDLSPLGPPSQSTESVEPLLRTGRTYGLTENPLTGTHLLALRNAHEKNADSNPIPRSNP